jgi:HlyB family type I secretion system ABC transporter
MGNASANGKFEHLVKNSPLLRFVPEAYFPTLQGLFQDQHYEFGDLIVNEGDAADAFYILTAGRARVLKKTEKGDELALQTLRPGNEFGELALLNGGQRSASVRCSTSVDLLRMGRDDFFMLLQSCPEIKSYLDTAVRHKVLHSFLYQFSNFGRLSPQALLELMGGLKSADFQKGERFIIEGDPPGPMYIVESGRVRIFTEKGGRRKNLAFCREGDFLGELSVLRNLPRAASAEAMVDSKLLFLDAETLVRLSQRHQDFLVLLHERLAQYQKNEEARLPADFTDEILPAEVDALRRAAKNGTAHAEEVPAAESTDPFADENGRFRKSGRKVRGVSPIQQIDEMDCGAACLGMICQAFGRKVSLTRIRQLCQTSLDGTSLNDICRAATELGLAARALKVSKRNLDQMPLPAIVHWDGNHWVVLLETSRIFVRVADPALGIRKVLRKEFEQKWTGYAGLFDFTADFQNAPVQRRSFAWLAPLVLKLRGVLFTALSLALVVSFLELLFPIFNQVVVDKVIVENDLQLLKVVLLAMGATLGFCLFANLLQQYLLSFAALRIDTALLDFITVKMLSLPMSYFATRRTGDIQRRLEGASQVRRFMLQHGIGGALAGVHLLGAVALMLLYSVSLTFIFLATMPLYAGLMVFSVKVLKPLFADIEESQGKYSAHQIDAIKGMEAVKAAAAELAFRETILREFLSVARKMFRSNFIVMSYDSVLQSIGLLSTALFLWFGANQVVAGNLTIGGFVAFGSLAAMGYVALYRGLGVWDNLQYIVVLLNRLGDIFDQEPEQGADRSRLTPVRSVEGHIEFQNVGFRYGGADGVPILQALNFTIAPGRMVAVVGRSGSGKTTLIKLLAGLIEPTEGTIRIDHIDLKSLNYRDLRRQIGMILQENHIFSQSIARNIAFGVAEPDYDRVLTCAQIANAHDFIMQLPMGYETRIGESGLALSGGQKQRVAIARALYHDPPILIFDEATSALDTESERAIQDNMARLLAGRTCLVIAHRLSTIRDADSIIVMERGRVAEMGNHDQLMAQRGLYFYLSSQQLGL